MSAETAAPAQECERALEILAFISGIDTLEGEKTDQHGEERISRPAQFGPGAADLIYFRDLRVICARIVCVCLAVFAFVTALASALKVSSRASSDSPHGGNGEPKAA